ncbi:MAG: ImmA/IrrE family metallo-endopeptidase [Candidatus Cloacimonetes bacterium]|nr:ImmA/IrrE family metallo-endopeptidase [Candidatus Cloacimonadota bacterium]
MSSILASIPVLCWAAKRVGLESESIIQRFPKWPLWLSGESSPSLRQLEDFARWTHTPIGYFFLPDVPKLVLPVSDFRTTSSDSLNEPSPELLDTIYLCQQRQSWFHDYARMHGLPRLEFCGSVTTKNSPAEVAESIRNKLDLSLEDRKQLPTWKEALRQLIDKAEGIGVLVMASSIVGSNSHRKLKVDEFRGFALVDDLAPLVFINASDSKAAQGFTLAHELAHIWLGESGVSMPQLGQKSGPHIEIWCNQVAAELLLPMQELMQNFDPQRPITEEIRRLVKLFKVSSLVVLRRLLDEGFLNQDLFSSLFRKELERIQEMDRGGSGGSFYRTLGARTGKRFARAVLSSTLEGQTLFQEAFRMLGVRKTSTFYEAAREFGVLL